MISAMKNDCQQQQHQQQALPAHSRFSGIGLVIDLGRQVLSPVSAKLSCRPHQHPAAPQGHMCNKELLPAPNMLQPHKPAAFQALGFRV